MKIALATQNGSVSAHFGHCEGFTIYDTDGSKVITNKYLQNPGHEPGFLPMFLKEAGVNLIIAGGMGERAQTLFSNNGIEVIVGVSGKIEDAVKSYLNGELKSTNSVCREHSHAGECSEH